MKFLSSLLILISLAQSATADEWQSLFNGKDLSGWRANNDPDSFTVENGLLRIQAAGKTSAHLFYVGENKDSLESFKNFELEATVRAKPNSNGGIFVHTDMSTRDKAQHLAKGYEVQLNSSKKEKRKTGSLYAIVDFPKSPVDETKWFVVRIVVNGKRIRVSINGKETVDYTEPENVQRPRNRIGRRFSEDGGAIGLQAHDKNSVWYFKEIKVKSLP